MARPQVLVHPQFNALYYSYFLQGLRDLYGAASVRTTLDGFPDLGHDCLAIRLRDGQRERRIYIHAHDSPSLPPEAIEWADVFGKVNLDPGQVPPNASTRIVPTGPVFPVRLWSPIVTGALAIRSLIVCNRRLLSYRRIDNDLRDTASNRGLLACCEMHLIQYARIHTYRRLAASEYGPGTSRDNYVFFSSGLWPETHKVAEWGEAHRQANHNRADFIRACRSLPQVEFEGGFWARKNVKVPNYEELTCPIEYRHETYIEKTRASAVVFNTPAYKKCHSWKLGEFLSLGKAIISVPIVRALPAPLVHGEHIHYVDGSIESIREAVSRICADTEYRRHLEKNARAYWEKWLEPARMMRRLIDAAAGGVAGEAAEMRPSLA